MQHGSGMQAITTSTDVRWTGAPGDGVPLEARVAQLDHLGMGQAREIAGFLPELPGM